MPKRYTLQDVAWSLEASILELTDDLRCLEQNCTEWERTHAKRLVLKQKLNLVNHFIKKNKSLRKVKLDTESGGLDPNG